MARRKDGEDLTSPGIKNETGGGSGTEEEESAHRSAAPFLEPTFLPPLHLVVIEALWDPWS